MNDSVCLEYINFVKKCIYKYFKLIMGKNFNKGIFDNLIHYFSPPLPKGFGRVTLSISGTRRLLKMIA